MLVIPVELGRPEPDDLTNPSILRDLNKLSQNSEILLQTAIFEAVFSYVRMAAEDARLDGSFEISPEKIINAMMKRTEIEIVDALIKSYNKRTFKDEED